MEVIVLVPFDRGDLVTRIHDEGEVLEETYSGEGTRLRARVGSEWLEELGPFLATEETEEPRPE